MKVLYIIDSLVGYGAEKSLAQMALQFKEVEPVFIHLYKGDEMKPILEKHGIKIHSLNLEPKTTFKKIRALVIPIVKIEKPQIIHSTLFKADKVARGIKKHFPNILLVGSFVSNSYSKNRYGRLDFVSRLKLFSTQIRDRISISKVDYIISNSQAIMETNLHALNVPREKVKVIYRGRKIEKEDISVEPQINFKQELGLLSSQIVFLNVGRLHKGKGQRDLVFSFKDLVQEVPNLVLLIAGEGYLRKELEDLIHTLDLQDKIYLLGYREDVPHLLALADYFIFPSYYEGLSGALVEAILAKIPCVVSNIPENRECFPEEGGLFFTAGDVKELKKRMQEALSLDWETKLAESQEYARAKFNIRTVSKEYEDFYKEIYDGFCREKTRINFLL
ncbi:glycosyl transferase [Salinimicrobium marinum]|uniref:Glycosyl transferase n=1 Tax=Salinimicrobium marinum TaxID=680283 RepID=A0A918VW68_9FLAO|nr:glycosyltransferase [Salinimicrobium marinum]GHA30354.1 glycosyl transferase [Salinimicrobium marinum]